MVEIVWFKKDLRVSDHAALGQAAECALENGGRVVCVYIYEDNILGAEDSSRRQLLFLNECLDELDERLRELGSRLVRYRGDVVEIFDRWFSLQEEMRLWSHEETGNGLTYERDLRVAAWAKDRGVEWNEIPQNGVVRRLKNRDGWSARWMRRMSQPVASTPGSLSSPPRWMVEGSVGAIAPEDFGKISLGETAIQQGGSRAGTRLLREFLNERGRDYTRAMSSPVVAFEACSRISPYLTYGALSIREVFILGKARQRQLKAMTAENDAERAAMKQWTSALNSFLGRLRWHCHFMQKLEDEPEIESRNLQRAFDGLRESDWNEDWYQAWAEGRTGYPMIDACMRALIATGWLNFRMRAMLMSFASYHLWLHWRPTGLHLARLFTDYEPGIHWSQAQMQSGVTGINTIRIYSPTKQAKDQDPKGVFIRQWVPELTHIPDALIAEPWKMGELEQLGCDCQIGVNYPAPIVDHVTAYKAAKERIYSVRNSAKAREGAKKIVEKHGSRRSSLEDRGKYFKGRKPGISQAP